MQLASASNFILPMQLSSASTLHYQCNWCLSQMLHCKSHEVGRSPALQLLRFSMQLCLAKKATLATCFLPVVLMKPACCEDGKAYPGMESLPVWRLQELGTPSFSGRAPQCAELCHSLSWLTEWIASHSCQPFCTPSPRVMACS